MWWVAVTRRRQPPLVVVDVYHCGRVNLPQAAGALHPIRLLPRLLRRGEQQRDQHRDDRDHDQQLDQREAGASASKSPAHCPSHEAPPDPEGSSDGGSQPSPARFPPLDLYTLPRPTDWSTRKLLRILTPALPSRRGKPYSLPPDRLLDVECW